MTFEEAIGGIDLLITQRLNDAQLSGTKITKMRMTNIQEWTQARLGLLLDL